MDIRNGKMVARKIKAENGKEYTCILLVSDVELPSEIPQDTKLMARVVSEGTSFTINTLHEMSEKKYEGWLFENILQDF